MEASDERPADVSFGRIVSFTDGVFAIAITLLVLNFEVPELARGTEAELERFLTQLGGDFAAYFLTFAVVGRMWIVHHRLFSMLKSFDGRLMTLNLAYLAMIVLIPFPAQLLGDYGDQTLSPVLYATVLAVASVLNWLMARHAIRARLLRPDDEAQAEPWGSFEALVIPGVFVASIPVAFLSPYAAEAMWTLFVLARAGAWVRSGRAAG